MPQFDPHAHLDAMVPRVHAELDRADRLHGHQILDPGTGPDAQPLAWLGVEATAAELRDMLRTHNDRAADAGTSSWGLVLLEEVLERLAEPSGTPEAEAEADQVVAVLARIRAAAEAARHDANPLAVFVEVARSGRYLVRCTWCGLVDYAHSLGGATQARQLHEVAHAASARDRSVANR